MNDSFDAYQKAAGDTAVYPDDISHAPGGLLYAVMGLLGEAGELANATKKILRGDKTLSNQRDMLIAELGDVMWYTAAIASELGVDLSEVAGKNIDKLRDRQQRDKIKGDGDLR